MSLVPITVEHPQYTQTFIVQVPQAGTVSDIKHEIARVCPGNPQVNGQRLISKGRLLNDEETIEALWVASEDARVVHLAVSPLSWSSEPPVVPLPQSAPEADERRDTILEHASRIRRQVLRARESTNNVPRDPPAFLPQFETLPFINYMHHKALRALSPATPPAAPGADDSASARDYAKATLQAAWPAILDKEFPPPSDGGVIYEYTLVGGKPFLQSLTPHATPTLRQQHALNVLANTFPLLSICHTRPNFNTFNSSGTIRPAHIHRDPNPGNIGVQRPEANGRVAIAVRINLREIMTPLILLFVRTLILLYFFSPARKPVFGILLGAYVLYEAWGAVRGAVFDIGAGAANGNDGAALQNDRRRRANPPNGPAVPNGAPAPPFQTPGAVAAANANARLEQVAQMFLGTEERWLENGAPEPSLFYKFLSFVFLLVMSIHPDFWNRRSAALRAREGRLRTEANAREAAVVAPVEGEEGEDERARQVREAREGLLARHAARPAWIKEYIERVRSGDWTDD